MFDGSIFQNDAKPIDKLLNVSSCVNSMGLRSHRLVKYYRLILTESKMNNLNEWVHPANVQILLLLMRRGDNLVLFQYVNSKMHIFDIIKYLFS